MQANSKEKISSLLMDLWGHFTKRRKMHFFLVLCLTIFTSFSEILSISALIPFLTALSDPQLLFDRQALKPTLDFFNINNPDELLFPLVIIFCLATLLAGAMRMLQAWVNTRAVFAAGADLSVKVYRKTLYQPYSFHVSRNTSAIINAAHTKTQQIVGGCILPIVNIMTSTIILGSIMSVLIYVDPFVAFISLIGFGSVYFVVIKIIRNRLFYNSKIIAKESDKVVKSLQEGLGGIRDVLIHGIQEPYCDIHKKAVFKKVNAEATNAFIAHSPRFVIEAIGMVLIAGLAYFLVRNETDGNMVIPVLGTLAFGAQRMLPTIQLIYYSWSSLNGSVGSLIDVVQLLNYPIPKSMTEKPNIHEFKKSIEFESLKFRYRPDLPTVLAEFNISIPKGSRVGIIGTTGSGKSTMLDILMALLEPTEGYLKVDGKRIEGKKVRAWQNTIAHVPQSIFLSDTSITENIAFGIPKEQIDQSLVESVAQQAQLVDTIKSMPNGFETLVGERGIRLSGGQRQRIGIARALYRQAEVLVFDEATSSLDNSTEFAVMKQISSLDRNITLLIIAHRLTSLSSCDFIIELEDGQIVRKCSYNEIMNLKTVPQ